MNNATRWFYRCDPGVAVAACTEEQQPWPVIQAARVLHLLPAAPSLPFEMPAGFPGGYELTLLCGDLQDCG